MIKLWEKIIKKQFVITDEVIMISYPVSVEQYHFGSGLSFYLSI